MPYALGTLLLLIGTAVGALVVRVFTVGKSAGQYVQEVQELHKALSIANRKHEQLCRDFYTLRLKLAKELGINGG